jgi:hypothetical protein
VVGHGIVELKTNHIPKGLIPLERLFNSNDVSRKVVIKIQEHEVIDCNIGKATNPKIVNISKALPDEQRYRYVSLMKNFVDIFAWSYEDLKTFDTEIIQQKIPLKVGYKPFRRKIRQCNRLLMSIIEK